MKKSLVVLTSLLILSLILISPVAFSEEEKKKPGDDEIKAKCAGLTGWEFRKCFVEAKRGMERGVGKFLKETEDVVEKMMKMHLGKDWLDKMAEHVKKGGNIFVIGPASNAMAAGEIQSVATDTLSVSTWGFISQWNISNAKILKGGGQDGTVNDLQVGKEVKVMGQWDKDKNSLVAKVVIVAEQVVVQPAEKPEKLPAPVPVLLQQILDALKKAGIEVQLPQR